jgi:predicted RNase H-like nuclease (RuvC/YqgF family)
MTNTNELAACYEALERLKNGVPRIERFIGLELDKITNSIVSQEAGHDKGYIKNKRVNHQGIVGAINDISNPTQVNTLSKSEVNRRHKDKVKNLNKKLELTEGFLEESLAREILLMARLKELEDELYKLNKVVRI